ncbi:MAG: cell wall hydrolase [Proteobacteria bacterium]|nr:cell wall hydrolase [Pseudomonadota bacterium]
MTELEDGNILARTIWGEARGEGEAGMTAVAAVIRNRACIAARYMGVRGRPHPLFGDGTIASACTAPRQFSCWNASDPNRAKLLAVTAIDPQFHDATRIAEETIGGARADPTNGADHYFEKSIPVPDWARGKTPTATIGHHVFFKLEA